MYISRQTYECDHHTVTPYKNFPINLLLENITCLLSDHPNTELTPLRKLEAVLRHTNNQEQVLIDYIHKNGTQDPNDIMTTEIDIIQQLTDEPDELTFKNFVNRYFNKYGFSHEVALTSSKNKYYFDKPNKYYLGKPINLITEPKPIKRLMPIYTYEQLTPENITKIVSEDFVQARAYTFNQIFKELSSEKEYDQEKGLIFLIRLIAQDRNDRKNHDSFALLLPDFDIEDIYDELDQHKQFVSVENKNLVYSLNKL